jgi:cyclic beta-1,2-glucan synthetase
MSNGRHGGGASPTQVRAGAEDAAWDGEWYRRAFFDDGTPLGSASNDECQIDSIPQSWAVISGAADPQRARQAMAVRAAPAHPPDDHLMLLFAPPFDRTHLDPGYIKGYAPGLRENGGQYTHAATWSIVAAAMLGDGDQAVELFNLLSPIQHASGRANLNRYKGEPYAVAADVYSQPPHAGRAGWTWYTAPRAGCTAPASSGSSASTTFRSCSDSNRYHVSLLQNL